MTTSQILLYRALSRSVDEHWVSWAVTMLEQGYDTPHLRILAGELPPFNQFEMQSLVDNVLEELNLDWSDRRIALENYTIELLRRMLQGEAATRFALAELKYICVELDYDMSIYDFYLLDYAHEDLQSAETQHYWPDTDRSNIEQRIKERALSWIEEHKGAAEQSTGMDGEDTAAQP